MKSHGQITTAALAALALLLCVPATAGATNPLLSGYGGPGEANQAILGATLSGTGSGGSGAAGGPSAASDTPRTLEVAPAGAGSGSAPRSSGSSAHQTHRPATKARGGSDASGAASGAYAARGPAASDAAAATEPLGVNGTDLLYIILAFGVLLLTALVTRRFNGWAGDPDRDAGG
jgi:hypothetical protein